MSKIKRLVASYDKFISVPWDTEAAPAQRIVFCVYDEQDERRLRAKVEEFELATRQNGHEWALFDLTDSFPNWLASEKYSQKYFERPELIPSVYGRYFKFIVKEFNRFLEHRDIDENHVVAILGVGSLFGFLKVKEVVEKMAPEVPGRLLAFFHGSYENNNYRLLDGYDGWNYLAVAITADKEF